MTQKLEYKRFYEQGVRDRLHDKYQVADLKTQSSWNAYDAGWDYQHKCIKMIRLLTNEKQDK